VPRYEDLGKKERLGVQTRSVKTGRESARSQVLHLSGKNFGMQAKGCVKKRRETTKEEKNSSRCRARLRIGGKGGQDMRGTAWESDSSRRRRGRDKREQRPERLCMRKESSRWKRGEIFLGKGWERAYSKRSKSQTLGDGKLLGEPGYFGSLPESNGVRR